MNKLKWVFFGTSDVSVAVLNDMKINGFLPSLIITVPDKPQGRKYVMTPPQVKIWAEENNVPVLQPVKLDDEFVSLLTKEAWELFVVAAYGKIIPKAILEIPKHKALNVHYSLLPKLRGSSPVEGAILTDERETGVTIIIMDEKMDHGPILAQEKLQPSKWPITRTELMNEMNIVAGNLLAGVIPRWINGEIVPLEQNHEEATFVKMIKKEDGLLDLNADPYENYKKIMAYERWPRTYFIQDNKRIVVNKAEWKEGKLEILRVTPEGRKEINFSDLKRN